MKNTLQGKGVYLSRTQMKKHKCIDCKKLLDSRAKKTSIRCSKCSNLNVKKLK